MKNNLHAREFINSFISKERKGRYLALLDSKMGERSLASRLAHLDTFEDAFIQSLPKGDPTVQIDFIYSFIKNIYNKEICYIISEDRTISGKEIPVKGSVEMISGKGFGSILSFIPGKLAYYEGESPGSSILFYKH
ncbi:hypothetical protein J7E24_06325 [Hymenobacter sp. ISL-91]|uniref:hypothetical protein n=1 Tax=Hymenobacter sp. ISL-91 TaxID=2819151 RepID=UPI001BEB310D|nr:hypothetical protein [Hymenobacter sp. ISL-91]MBT2557394.1 hypothetical protein [Hymenobacter sp. ISL-91]